LLALAVVGLVFFLAIPAAVAEEFTADDYMEFSKPNVGTWKATSESNGKTETGTFRFRPARNGKCFLLYSEGLGGPPAQQLEGYDPVSKKIVAWGFTGGGDCWLQTISVDGLKKGMKMAPGISGTWDTRVSTRDGKTITTTSKWTLPRVDEQQLVLVWSDLKEDGKPIPDKKITLERQPDQRQRPQSTQAAPKADSEGVTAADYIEFWKPLMGSWKTVTDVPGNKAEGTWRLRLSPNRMCLMTYSEGQGRQSRQSIDGYDPATKRWTTASFDSEGGYSLGTITLADMHKGKHFEKGVIGKWERQDSTKDGKTTTTTYLTSCDECTEKRIVIRGSNGIHDGKPSLDLILVMERQPDRGRRARQ